MNEGIWLEIRNLLPAQTCDHNSWVLLMYPTALVYNNILEQHIFLCTSLIDFSFITKIHSVCKACLSQANLPVPYILLS